MKRWSALLHAVPIAWLLFSLSATAFAQDAPPDDPRMLFQRGHTAYQQGDYEGAIAQWTRAFEVDPRPLLQFNLSQAYERLGRLTEAIDAVERYLATADPNDSHQSDARARLATLRERVRSTAIRVQGGPEGAAIVIDDEDRGRTPRPDPIQVLPGSHRIVVRAEGFREFRSDVVVPAGQTLDVRVDAQPLDGPVAGRPFPVVPVVLFASGGVLLVTGAVLGGVALSEANGAPSREGPQADTARSLAIAADVSFGLGAACGIAGLVLLLVMPGDEAATDTTPAVSAWAAPGGGGVVASGRF